MLEDLRDLEESGIISGDETVKAALSCISGDNLVSHNGGFTENFSRAEYRYYEITQSEFQSYDVNACDPQRTSESYNSVVDNLQTEGSQEVKGINSVFNTLKSFLVCQPGLGHDMFEGVLAYDIAVYLKYFIKEKKRFTCALLN